MHILDFNSKIAKLERVRIASMRNCTTYKVHSYAILEVKIQQTEIFEWQNKFVKQKGRVKA